LSFQVFGIGSIITVLSGALIARVGILVMLIVSSVWVLAATVASWLFAARAQQAAHSAPSVKVPLINK
jgi:hypothetical protein